MTPSEAELRRVKDEAIAACDRNPLVAVALINYQAAQLIANKLDSIDTILTRMNDNFWMSRK